MGKAPELLAPAGNLASLHAAVRAGADAVYLGVESFNARRNAENFTLQNLPEVCDWAHLRGVKLYLTVNTAIMPSEFPAALETVRQAWRAGIDAFIVQDVGLAKEMSKALPQARLHVSTQMNTHNAAGVEAAARLGASRITLARESTLGEVAHLCEMARRRGMEVETFCHGAICICYSGQCLLSSLVGGRSANRGMCAQPCRLPLELHNRAQRNPLAAPGEHLLSPKDLCTIDLLPELASAGVSSLKIEGRMKSPEYVSAVVGVYRAVLDRAVDWLEAQPGETARLEAPESARASEQEKRILSEAFSRGFTEGYLMGIDDNDLMGYGRPNNRGVLVGRVAKVQGGMVSIETGEELARGDVLEFWTNRGHFAHTVSNFTRKGKVCVLSVDRKVGRGDRVFRVRSAAAAFVDDDVEPRVAVSGRAQLRKGERASLELWPVADEAYKVALQGEIVEEARTKALSAQDVRDHIDRFGTTPFALADLSIGLDEGVGMGFSQLHRLRAAAAEQLQERMLRDYHSRTLEKRPRRKRQTGALRQSLRCRVVALATNPACARAAKKAGADVVFVPALNFKRGEAQVAGQLSQTVAQAGYPKMVDIALPAICHDALPGTREERFSFDAYEYVKPGKRVYADSLAGVVRAAEMGALPEAGTHIPVTNAHTVRALAELGATRVWLSPELALGQIQQIGEETDVPLGIVASGAAELMVTEHCLLMSQGPCKRDCTQCPRRKSPHYYKDRKGFELPVLTDALGRGHLYNAVALDILHILPDLVASGVTAFMVDTTLLNTEETARAVSRAVRARNLSEKDSDTVGKASGATTGHLFRAVQ